MTDKTISESTRRDIIDYFVLSNIPWSGRLTEPDFLSRLYDLTKLPSTDRRLKNAKSDIYQHRLNFVDWDDDWVFTDNRFGILWASDGEFLRFLCETVHPIVRPNPDDAKSLVEQFNTYLKQDGWEIFEEKELSGRPVFGSRKIGSKAIIFDEPTGWSQVDRQVQEIRLRLQEADSEEEYQAIGLLSRETMISLAQTVYDKDRHGYPDGVKSSSSDAARMLEAFFLNELSGSSNEEARGLVKTVLRLANALQHRRTADFKMAALCAEVTSSVVNLVAIIMGRYSV